LWRHNGKHETAEDAISQMELICAAALEWKHASREVLINSIKREVKNLTYGGLFSDFQPT
jgi:hypothetical protein